VVTSATLKYVVLVALGLVIALATYLQGQPTVTYSVVLGAVLIGATFLVRELESGPTSSTPAAPGPPTA